MVERNILNLRRRSIPDILNRCGVKPFAIRFPLPTERGLYEIDNYHCWAAFYLNGYGWVSVDVSEGYKDMAKKEYFFGAHNV